MSGEACGCWRRDLPGHSVYCPAFVERSADLTPGVVWTDSQLAVVRDLAAQTFKAQAALSRVETAVANLNAIAKVIEFNVANFPASQYKANELGKAMGYRRSAIDLRKALDGNK